MNLNTRTFPKKDLSKREKNTKENPKRHFKSTQYFIKAESTNFMLTN